jgi:predicted enzyme related to lactoylglutathione lyase
MQHGASDSPITYQKVGASAQDKPRYSLLAEYPNAALYLLRALDIDEKIRRTADAKGGVVSHRFVEFDPGGIYIDFLADLP